MSPLEEALTRLSARQQARIRVLWDRLERGDLTRAEFITVATNLILAGNARGYALGAATVRAMVERAVGTPEVTVATPAPRHLDPSRVNQALLTILASDLDTAMQLARLVDNEPKAAAADGSADVIARSPRVKGWTRTLDSGACQLCLWWWREGRVWQPDHPMPRHTGCTCSQTPVVKQTDNYQTARQSAERSRERSNA